MEELAKSYEAVLHSLMTAETVTDLEYASAEQV